MPYLDTSAFVALFVREPKTDALQALVRAARPPLLISNWVGTEFESALALKLRVGPMASAAYEEARVRATAALLTDLFRREEVVAADFERAGALIAQRAAPLRAGDALHVALCLRLDAELVTLDVAMARAAVAAGARVNLL